MQAKEKVIVGSRFLEVVTWVKIDIYAIKRNFFKVTDMTKGIWAGQHKDGKCYICKRKFRLGQQVSVLFTRKEFNKMVCTKCFNRVEEKFDNKRGVPADNNSENRKEGRR